MELLLPILAIIAGFAALVWGADRFVEGSAGLAHNLGVSPLVIGLTIVGFGTSAPEMLVSSMAAARGVPGLSIGNAIGSNITNIALVLGAAAMMNPLKVHGSVLKRELPVLLGAMLLASGLLLDGTLGRVDGGMLLGALVLLVGWTVLREARAGSEASVDDIDEIPEGLSTKAAIGWIMLGLFILLGSSELLVWGAKEVARHFGVGERIIGLTVVALGTSLPELAATLVAAKRNEHDIAVGNIIGSNLFNTLGVLGLPGLISPSEVDAGVLHLDIPVMLGVVVLLFLLARFFRPYRMLSRGSGAFLLLVYAAYIGYLGLSLFGATT